MRWIDTAGRSVGSAIFLAFAFAFAFVEVSNAEMNEAH